MDRRWVLGGLAVWFADKLLNGFIGGIPWRVIDSINSRQNVPRQQVRMVGGCSAGVGGSVDLT